jgi:4-amino-4-deoxy-L-arabinose transferase-like glycosyltransferase
LQRALEALRIIGCTLLGALFLRGIHHLGQTYFHGFPVEYGFSVNLFGPLEGIFLFLYALLGGAAVLFFSMALRDHLPGWVEKLQRVEVNPTLLVALISALVLMAAVWIRFNVLHEAPMTDDEHAFTFGAQILETGQLSLPGYRHELRPFLANQFVMMGDSIYTQYFPGFMALLALAMKLGVPWLLNPLMGALGVVGTFLLGRELSGSKWIGVGAGFMLLLSPTYLFTSAMLFSHPVALTFTVFGLWMLTRARASGSWSHAGIGAMLLGVALFTRPLTTMVLSLVGAAMLLSGPISDRKKLQCLGTAALVGLVFVAGLAAYNGALTGDPFRSGYDVNREVNGVERFKFTFEQFTSGEFLELLVFPFIRYNFWLLGWPCSLFLLFFVPPGELRRFALAGVIGVWLAHLPWTAVGVNLTGAVHYYEALPLLAILCAAGWAALLERKKSAENGMLNAVVFSSIFVSLVLFYPWAAGNLGQLAERNNGPYVATENIEKPAIIFTGKTLLDNELRLHRFTTWTFFRRNNDPELTNDVLWFNDLGPDNRIAMAIFSDRHFYRLVSSDEEDGTQNFAAAPIEYLAISAR